MQVPIEVAYAAACQKLGEAQVREALMIDAMNQKDVRIKELEEKLQAEGLIDEATEIVEGAADADQRDGSGVRTNGSVPDQASEG